MDNSICETIFYQNKELNLKYIVFDKYIEIKKSNKQLKNRINYIDTTSNH